jgi:hypothetical protein
MRRMAPALMKPIPERMPRGRRIRSRTTKESDALPVEPISRLAWRMATHAARHTRMVVRMAAAWPLPSLLIPMSNPDRKARASLMAICW